MEALKCTNDENCPIHHDHIATDKSLVVYLCDQRPMKDLVTTREHIPVFYYYKGVKKSATLEL